MLAAENQTQSTAPAHRSAMDELASISQHLLQFSPDALIVVDARGVIQFANDATRSLFGYERGQLVGQPMEMLIPDRFRGSHAEHVSAYWLNPTSREIGARSTDLRARRADGSEFSADIRLSPFRNSDGQFVAAAVRDVSERRAINDALIAAREEADRANRAKSRFLATASHDLRQPLQTIRLLNASMLKMTRQTPGINDLLRQQEQAIDGATRLLNALLDISRFESGAIDLQLARVGVAEIFSSLAREFMPSAAARNLRLEFAETHSVISTDRTLLTQLLQNLIENALKYTEHGCVRVFQHVDADALVLSVEDSGVGIPEDKVARIFDEYYQVDPNGSRRLGVGLGLTIVREVSRLLGYSVTVSSKVGEGTRVHVRIPVHDVLPDTEVAAQQDGGAPTVQAPTRCRVVLLEDNDAVRRATELYLALEGYEMHGASSVAEAEPLFAGLEPGDLFITDYQLDGRLTGLDVLQKLRVQQKRDVPAIVLSGDLQSVLRLVKTQIPRCRFLSKPVDAHALLRAIAEVGGGQ
jgi:PAS domain S-box-containing protein